jgi:hypothetical protein
MFGGAFSHLGLATDVSRQRTNQLIEKQGKPLIQLSGGWSWG